MNKILQLYRDNAGRDKRPVNVARNADEASLYIYDVIDSYWGVSAVQVIDALGQVADAQVLNVYINSPGGDVFEGRAIMAALSRFAGKKIAHIDSLCASAATSIALACDEVEITDGAFFMIHNASGLAWGDKNAMRETADLLEKVEGSIVSDYVNKTGKDQQQVVDWMNAETWFNAAEAVENGFVDRITPSPAANKGATNMWNLAAYGRVPQALANVATNKKPETPQAKVTVVAPDSDPDDALNADEVQFLKDAVAMHEAAIARAKAVLPLATSDDVEDLAEKIISGQAGDLELMRTWLDLGAAPEPDDEPEPAATNQSTPVGNSMTQANRNRLALLTAL